MKIPFNKPFIAGNELQYIQEAVDRGQLSGNGYFTQRCHTFFEEKFGFNKVLLTQSGTAALEMAALLIDIHPGDEVIVPAFTFVSAANAFMLRGAKIIFADSCSQHPNMDVLRVRPLITSRTRAIVAAHYGGTSIDMQPLLELAIEHKIYIVEDAASCIGSTYRTLPVGSIGHLAAFSFHETKNISAGEGGMLVINDERLQERAEVIWEKGTNRVAFFQGKTDHYDWMDIGSSYLPSEITAAWLQAQTEVYDMLQNRRRDQWNLYYELLRPLITGKFCLIPEIPGYAGQNHHVVPLICKSAEERAALILFLAQQDIMAVFHYQSLPRSPFFRVMHDGRSLSNSDHFSATLVRLPLYFGLSDAEIRKICDTVIAFYKSNPVL